MESLEGKYFEKVTAELKKVKEQEKIVPDQQFRDNLRSGLVQKASEMSGNAETEFGWDGFWSKWKYALGAVPTLAILTVVAMNWTDFKVNMKSNEYVPMIQENDNSTNQNDNLPAVDSALNRSLTIGTAIQTFPADQVLPPADVLEKYLNEKRGIGTEIPKDVFPEVNLPDSSDAEPMFLKTLDEPKSLNLKITEPVKKEEVEKDSVDKLNEGEYFVIHSRKTVTVVPKEGNIPDQNQGLVPAQESQNQIVQEQVRPEESGHLPDQNITQNVNESMFKQDVPAAQNVNSFKQDTVNQLNVGSFSSNYFEASRVRYKESDLASEAMRISQFIMSEFSSRNGNYSSDYYFEVSRLDSGTLKVSLFENGNIKKLIFVKLIDGQYQTVTEINY